MKYKISRLPGLILMSIFCLQAKSAEQIPCEIAVPLITSSYKRTKTAYDRKEFLAAHHYKMAFWDFFNYAKHCRNVEKLKDELKNAKLGENDPLILGSPSTLSQTENVPKVKIRGKETSDGSIRVSGDVEVDR